MHATKVVVFGARPRPTKRRRRFSVPGHWATKAWVSELLVGIDRAPALDARRILLAQLEEKLDGPKCLTDNSSIGEFWSIRGSHLTKTQVIWLAGTTAFEGLRAGAGTFRLLIDLPARARLGSVAFAQFSRATDLSTGGFVFWALYGIGGAVLTGTTWWVLRRSTAEASIRRLSVIAATCSLVILALTTQAAPLMLQVGSAPDDEVSLARLLEPFVSWTIPRILCADVSFCALLAALTLVALGARSGTTRS